jgi:hypothetical protein
VDGAVVGCGQLREVDVKHVQVPVAVFLFFGGKTAAGAGSWTIIIALPPGLHAAQRYRFWPITPADAGFGTCEEEPGCGCQAVKSKLADTDFPENRWIQS